MSECIGFEVWIEIYYYYFFFSFLSFWNLIQILESLLIVFFFFLPIHTWWGLFFFHYFMFFFFLLQLLQLLLSVFLFLFMFLFLFLWFLLICLVLNFSINIKKHPILPHDVISFLLIISFLFSVSASRVFLTFRPPPFSSSYSYCNSSLSSGSSCLLFPVSCLLLFIPSSFLS